MGQREEIRQLNRRGHAPKVGTTEFITLTGVTTGWILVWNNIARSFFPGDSGLGAAPVAASYVTLGSNPTLTDERVIVAGVGITYTDSGAGGTLTTGFDVNDGDGIAWQLAGGAGPVGVTADLSVTGQSHGSIITRGSAAWQNLSAGSSGQVLTAQGALQTPLWATVPTDAPTNASYVTLGLDGTLTAERVLESGAGISQQDGGANAALTLLLWFPSEAHGDVAFRGSANWERLAAGTSAQLLTSKGTGQDPSWEDATAVPAATTVGMVLFSTNGTSFTAEVPLTTLVDGWLVNDDGILLVEG